MEEVNIFDDLNTGRSDNSDGLNVDFLKGLLEGFKPLYAGGNKLLTLIPCFSNSSTIVGSCLALFIPSNLLRTDLVVEGFATLDGVETDRLLRLPRLVENLDDTFLTPEIA